MVSNIGETLVRIYDTNDKSALTLAAIAGVGFTARAANGGYQIRIEGRDNIVGYRGVTGATPAGIVTPDTKVRYQHLLSLVLGFEIVLERSRGRRY
jgi:hypothetical protein